MLRDLWGPRPVRHRQAQHEIGRLRRAGRMAPGLGVLSAHQRRPRRGRHHDRRCRHENGPMLVVPGSHRGPIFDHHGPDGRFCGAMDPAERGVDLSKAVPCLGKAGSITVHHVRAVHGSATNFSGARAPLAAVPVPRRRRLAAAAASGRDREVRRAAGGRRADRAPRLGAGAGAPAAAAGRAPGLDLRKPARHRAGGFSRPAAAKEAAE